VEGLYTVYQPIYTQVLMQNEDMENNRSQYSFLLVQKNKQAIKSMKS
jgi:hypothetical protein